MTLKYKEPDLEWLKKAFKDVKLGWLKASEMEVYLAYMLMYANNDLGRVAYEVADEYGYTESKVAKLQVEFARRFKTKEDDIAFLNRIFNAMINKTDPHRIVPIVRKETISFTLYDAGDARKLRNIICRTGMMAISDSSKLVFNLTLEVFAALFVDVKGECDVGYGEFRMMLVPEYEVAEGWSIGARLGVAFDWLRARGSLSTWSRTTINIPGIPSTSIPVGPSNDSEKFSDFVAQGVVGLQTTYLFTDNLGFYSAIDYRVGDEAEFKKNGEKYGSLNMNGWYASAGLVLQF